MSGDSASPSAIMQELKRKSKLIAHQIQRRDRGEFKSVNDGIALQRLQREAQRLREQLPPLQLI